MRRRGDPSPRRRRLRKLTAALRSQRGNAIIRKQHWFRYGVPCRTEGVTVSSLGNGNHVVAQVQVEFYGIPRARAGVALTSASANTLGDLVLSLSKLFPVLGECCFDGPQFRQGYTANLCGDRFTTDPGTPLSDGDTVLVLSLDAGG